MKKFFLAAIIFFGVTCAGCLQSKFDLIVTGDGAVVRNWKIIGTAPFSRQIEDWKIRNEQLIPNLKVKPVSEGNMLGYEFSADYPDVESFARSHSEIYAAHAGKNRGISKRAGWFFDEYDFDFICVVPRENLPPEVDYLTQAAFEGVVYDFKIQLPYRAESCDADEISADGKILQWNLAPLLIKGGERHMNARFKIWHRDKIIFTAAIELLLLAATIFFFVKARAENLETVGKDLCFKRNVFAALSVALAVVAAYMIFAPINFTDADIISVAAP